MTKKCLHQTTILRLAIPRKSDFVFENYTVLRRIFTDHVDWHPGWSELKNRNFLGWCSLELGALNGHISQIMREPGNWKLEVVPANYNDMYAL